MGRLKSFVCVCVSGHLKEGGLVRNKKNKRAMDDFNDDKSGRGYPRRRD